MTKHKIYLICDYCGKNILIYSGKLLKQNTVMIRKSAINNGWGWRKEEKEFKDICITCQEKIQ